VAKPLFDLYAGVSGLELSEDVFDLGDGVVLSRTYAHLMAPPDQQDRSAVIG
jgi:hypothetical protein